MYEDDDFFYDPDGNEENEELKDKLNEAINICQDALERTYSEMRKNYKVGLYISYAKGISFSREVFGHLLELQPLIDVVFNDKLGTPGYEEITEDQILAAIDSAIEECCQYKPAVNPVERQPEISEESESPRAEETQDADDLW